MNLATRCSSCGTLFRVVQDQLKVSEGWVRCGHCQAVFNALESLFDLDLEPSPGGPAETTAAASHDAPRVHAPAAPPTSRLDGFASADDDRIHASRAAPSGSGPYRQAPAIGAHRSDPTSTPPAVVPSTSPGEPPFESGPVGLRHPEPDGAPPATARSSAAEAPAEFRRRSVAAPRRHPAVWIVLALGLAALLGAQASLHARDRLAARWPALRPVLASGCSVLACRLALPRSIDELVVENTGLVKTALPGAFKLSVGLRNRDTVALALPSVELSLTDTRGELIARRVLAPRDFDKAPDAIRPGADTVLQALLATPDSLVSGYTVEIFYP